MRKIYPKKGVEPEIGEENLKKRADLVLRFTDQDEPGEKFKNYRDKLYQALTLPQPCKESLGLPEDLVEKVRQGLALWEEKAANEDDEEEEDDGEDGNKKHELSEEEKMLRKCYGEGMYAIIPSFFRTLVFLKK